MACTGLLSAQPEDVRWRFGSRICQRGRYRGGSGALFFYSVRSEPLISLEAIRAFYTLVSDNALIDIIW